MKLSLKKVCDLSTDVATKPFRTNYEALYPNVPIIKKINERQFNSFLYGADSQKKKLEKHKILWLHENEKELQEHKICELRDIGLQFEVINFNS